MVDSIGDFGYSSPEQLEREEHNKSEFDPISGNGKSETTGKKKEISPSEQMLIGTAQVFAKAGQLDKAQIAGIGAGLRAPSFQGTPKAEAEETREVEKKVEESQGKINIGEAPKTI